METSKNPWGSGDHEDKELLQPPAPKEEPRRADFTTQDPWRILRIQGEIVEGFDALSRLPKAIAVLARRAWDRIVLTTKPAASLPGDWRKPDTPL